MGRRSIVRFGTKRLLDIVGATILIVLLSPLLVLIAVAIKVDSPGPALFRQKRVGASAQRNGRYVTWERTTFVMYKFRSMTQNADQSAHERHVAEWVEGSLAPDVAGGETFKLESDPRVTRVGRFIRRTSLDELPQLVNVLKGDMSLVGPRPVPLYEAAAYTPEQLARLNALPGVTGIWQVYGRGRVSFEEMIEMDLEYVRRQSLWLDVKLLLATVPAAFSGRGAR